MRVNFKALKAHLPEIAIVLIAVFLRVWLIEIKPAHFDEGINGWFADQMRATGYHKYDPTNYHGPLRVARSGCNAPLVPCASMD